MALTHRIRDVVLQADAVAPGHRAAHIKQQLGRLNASDGARGAGVTDTAAAPAALGTDGQQAQLIRA